MLFDDQRHGKGDSSLCLPWRSIPAPQGDRWGCRLTHPSLAKHPLVRGRRRRGDPLPIATTGPCPAWHRPQPRRTPGGVWQGCVVAVPGGTVPIPRGAGSPVARSRTGALGSRGWIAGALRSDPDSRLQNCHSRSVFTSAKPQPRLESRRAASPLPVVGPL